MRAIDHHLYDRNGRYYYRSVLPNHLKPFLPFNEIKLSLGTNDLAQARFLVAKLDIELNKFIFSLNDALKTCPTQEGLEIVRQRAERCYEELRQSVGLTNIRKPPHWYKTALNAYAVPVNSLTLSQVSEEYLKDCITNTRRTIEQKRTAFKLFIAIIGDLSLKEIKREQARLYKSSLLKIPKHYLQRLGETSYSEIDWKNLPKGEPQSHQTINSKILPLCTLFTWAEKNDLYEGNNPFKGLMIAGAKKPKIKRVPYKENELKVLFSGLLNEQGYKYWIPLIGLYTGMRLNEICQLERSDIEELSGIWCFNINDSNGKRLKTTSSARIVPIHQRLIELGFLEYARGRNESRIFGDLEIGYNGSYSYNFTKWYSRFLTRLGIKKDGLCFHSFRHTFIDGMRNAGVEKAITMKLVGHDSSNDIHSGYGYGYSLEVLQTEINRLCFSIWED